MEKAFAGFLLAFTVVLFILYGVFVEYAPPAATQGRYLYFQDVHVMIFIGFGFLMSFLHKGGFTATGHAFFVACYTGIWAILLRGFWLRAIKEDAVFDNITLGVTDLVGADFAAGAILISFGAVLGRVSASQLLLMAIVECIFYTLNEAILVERFHVADIGGSMVIHTFGAYFGIACTFALEKVRKADGVDSTANGSSRVSDTMAMIGTLFLFCFWPSFNGALAAVNVQERAVVNTVLSIFMSAIATFIVTCLVDAKGKFGMVEVQNSTIAGGVAIGAAADMVVNPIGAMIVGFLAGALSVVGYRFITPALESKLGLRDTCGVHNLHGLPGVFAAIVSMIAVGAADKDKYKGTYGSVFAKPDRSQGDQAGYQMAALVVTLLFSIVGGAITGAIIAQLPTLEAFFDDTHEYEVPGEETAPAAADHAATEKEMDAKPNEPISA